jgi:diketogulonate reductase-like aldo/keto reductase
MQITDLMGTVSLHNSVQMPYFGLGVFQSTEGEEVFNAVNWALEAGYRHIDTAAIYQNEVGVGKAIESSNMKREDIFVTSKVWNSDQGYDSTLNAYEVSLKKLNLDYLDLYLIHWPVAGKFIDTWKALEKLYTEGRVKAIGVSNFLQHHLNELLYKSEIVPMVNQMEFHPLLVQQRLLDFCKSKGIQYQAWSPIMRGKVADYEIIERIGKKYGKTAVQVTLRWDLQKGVVTIPKSVKKERIISNADIFDFELIPEEVAQIDALDKNERTGPDPDNFNF